MHAYIHRFLKNVFLLGTIGFWGLTWSELAGLRGMTFIPSCLSAQVF